MNLLLKRAICRNLPKVTLKVNNVNSIQLCEQISPDSEVTEVYFLLYLDPQDILFQTIHHDECFDKILFFRYFVLSSFSWITVLFLSVSIVSPLIQPY